VKAGYCDKHRAGREAARRKRRGPKPYDRRAWRDRIRPMQLGREPLCHDCLGRGRATPAEDVHHKNGDATDDREGNLMSLCHECHSRRTLAENRGPGGG